METLQELRPGFVKPPSFYGLMPLWDLNNDLSSQDLQWGLEEQAKQGITGVFLHPRSGMQVEYLSDAYWAAIKESVRVCEALGLETWLYDEYNWPSGVAGGKLLREHPEYRQVFLDYRQTTCSPGQACELAVPATAQILSARACCEAIEEMVDLAEVLDGNQLRWVAPHSIINPATASTKNSASHSPGPQSPVPTSRPMANLQSPSTDWTVIVLFTDTFPGRLWASDGAPWTQNEAGALDYLNPDAVREFISLTHEQYRKQVGAHFGKQIRGIFTDEPATFYGWQWTPRLPDEFQARCGYDLLPHLHELVLPVGNYIKTRCDYHQVALDLYAYSFFRQISEWCKKNNLEFTGHLLYEDKLDFLPTGQGGVLATFRELQMPGIDYLGDRTGYEPTVLLPAPNVGPKTLSSIAHALKRPRTLVELYGGNGWSTSLARYKNVLNWIQACGVNFICPHAVYLSLKGHRKRDFPASHFVQDPWWRYYRQFAEYTARLSYLNSQGHHVADIAFLYPQRTFWVEYILNQKTAQWNWLAASFGTMTKALLRIQRDYDFLFEELLTEGNYELRAGRLKIGDASYSIVILPPLTTIPLLVMERLRDFWRDGGTLLAFGELPKHSTQERNDPRLVRLCDEIFARPSFDAPPSRGRALLVPLDPSDDMDWESLLKQQLDAYSSPDVELDAPFAREMICQHRRTEDADLYLIANLSDAAGECLVNVRGVGGAEIWDIEHATMSPLASGVLDDGRTEMGLYMQPQQAVWLVVSPTLTRFSARPLPNRETRTRAIEIREWEIELARPNCLLLDPWHVRVLDSGDEREMLTSRYDSLEALSATSRQQAAQQGLDPSEWTIFMRVARDPEMQSRSRGFPPAGMVFERTTTVHCEFVPEDIALVFEDLEEAVELSVNGAVVSGEGKECFVWDRSNREISLRNLFRVGANTIRVQTRMPDYRALPPGTHGLEPIILRGRFGVRDGVLIEPHSHVNELRSWSELGYPNYSGALTYRATVTIPASLVTQRLVLACERVCETMEVVVNGIPAGIRLWHPFEVEVGDLVQPGENEFAITVTNTLSNLLTRPLPSGLVGPVTLDVAG